MEYSNINLKKNIIKFLYEKKMLNCQKLLTILNYHFKLKDYNSKVNVITKDENRYLINKFIKSFENSFLEIYLIYKMNGINNINIENEFYETAIKVENYNAFIILYNNNKRDKYLILLQIFKFFDTELKESKQNFIYNIKHKIQSQTFQNFDTYNYTIIENFKNLFINEKKT